MLEHFLTQTNVQMHSWQQTSPAALLISESSRLTGRLDGTLTFLEGTLKEALVVGCQRLLLHGAIHVHKWRKREPSAL